MSPLEIHPSLIVLIEGVLAAFQRAGIRYGVLNGLENFPARSGRDIDIFVHPDDDLRALNCLEESLMERGWNFGVHRMAIGMDQVFARLGVADVGTIWIEFDLVHHHPLCWGGQELVPMRFADEDLILDGAAVVYPWGWFCKNLLIQLLAGQRKKFLRNIESFRRKTLFVEPVRRTAERLGYRDVAALVLDWKGSEDDCRALQLQAKMAMFRRAVLPRWWGTNLRRFFPWLIRSWKLHVPPRGCVPKVIIVASERTLLDNFTKAFATRVEATLPIAAVVVRTGRPGPKPRWIGEHLLQLARGGWARDLRDSSWLFLLVDCWLQDPKTGFGPGTKVTPYDLVLELGGDAISSHPDACVLRGEKIDALVEEAIQLLGDRFLKNLTP